MNGLQPASMALDEQLHTDVMRFMAIIAFCLMAIFALVRNTTPLTAELAPAAPEPVVAVDIAAPPEVVAPPVAVSAPPATEPTQPVPAVVKVAPPEPEPAPLAWTPRRVEPAPVSAPTPAPVAAATVAMETPPVPLRDARPAPAPVAVHEPQPEPEPEQGLELRFVDDPAFLRLLAAGKARLYAGEDNHWRQFGADQAWRPSPAPPQFHELLLDTLPRVTLLGYPGDAQQARWGVVLPGNTESAIASLLTHIEHGTLLIDRHGEVRLSR